MPATAQEKFPKAVVTLKDGFVPTNKARDAIRNVYQLNVDVVAATPDVPHATLIFTPTEGNSTITPQELENSVRVVLDILEIGGWAYTLELLAGTTRETENTVQS